MLPAQPESSPKEGEGRERKNSKRGGVMKIVSFGDENRFVWKRWLPSLSGFFRGNMKCIFGVLHAHVLKRKRSSEVYRDAARSTGIEPQERGE
jgi:hypothetical protein